MTKKEFIQYLSSFNKEPGKYSLDELYRIGVAHKKLAGRDKNWDELAILVGTHYTGEQYRKMVVRMQDRDGTLTKNVNTISTKTVGEITDMDVLNKTQELLKQQQRIRDERTALTKKIRDESRIDALKDAIRESAEKLQVLPSVSYAAPTRKLEKEAVLLFSDLHIGVELDKPYNTYNHQIAEVRVMKLVDDTIHYCKTHNVKKLNFINLGDLIHGLIHVTARIEEQFGVIEQVMFAAEIVSKALNKLQEAAPEIIYRSCTDNHSRTVANKSEAIEKDNFGRLVDWFLEERLKNTKIKFAKDNYTEDLGGFELQNGKFVAFSHGHLDNPNESFQKLSSIFGRLIDFAFMGHYHNERVKSYQGSRVYINGSIVGPDDYAHGKRLYGVPSQTLLVFDGDNIINHSIELDIRSI
jgi:cell division protein ZapA (FtsZ GTPase activity inhibitor)